MTETYIHALDEASAPSVANGGLPQVTQNSLLESTSEYRVLLNEELARLLDGFFGGHPLLDHARYHLQLDEPPKASGLAHSKRLRGILALLVSEGLNGSVRPALPLACAVELYHNSSLILDDIQDCSLTRCGRQALWRHSGTADATNTAFLLLQGGQLAVLEHTMGSEIGGTALRELAQTSTLLAQGQTRDLHAQQHWSEGLGYYLQTARLKTGALLGTSCVLGALPQSKPNLTVPLRNFGVSLGVAHQLEDDLDDVIHAHVNGHAPLDSGNILFFLATTPDGFPRNAIHHIAGADLLSDPEVLGNLAHLRQCVRESVFSQIDSLPLTRDVSTHINSITHAICQRNDAAAVLSGSPIDRAANDNEGDRG